MIARDRTRLIGRLPPEFLIPGRRSRAWNLQGGAIESRRFVAANAAADVQPALLALVGLLQQFIQVLPEG